MHRLFKPKTIRRMLVFAAMIAPAVYLFGSLFSALSGAHASFPFDADYDVPVSSYVEDYNQLRANLKADYSGSVQNTSVSTDGFFFTFNGLGSGGGRNSYADFFVGNQYNISLVSGHQYLFVCSSSLEHLTFYLSNSSNNSVFFQATSSTLFNSPTDVTVHMGFNTEYNYLYDNFKVSFSIFDVSRIYPLGVPALSDLLERFPNVYYPYVSSSYSDVIVYGQPDNSQFIFNQFFAKDNFLVQWGENAISENPYGFAPFGAFWRYLDLNVFHLSNDQVGLMGYGYMYYACHVLLFDVGFILVTFFLSFIQRMADKFGGDA